MKTWFITGASSGLGQALAAEALIQGNQVVATFRKKEQAEEFSLSSDQATGIVMDVTNPDAVGKAASILENMGDLDVLVNNAGVGFAGAVEEATEDEVRRVMEANFFGSLNVLRAILPQMRGQKRGHILQVSSHAGFKGFPGFGIYNASKFAMEGYSEALAIELAPLGIHLTLVEPGPFRTNFAGRSLGLATQVIQDYADTAGVFRSRIQEIDGKQEGDPEKAARAMIRITTVENPPLRLPLGRIAIQTMQTKLDMVRQDIEAWKELAESAVYED